MSGDPGSTPATSAGPASTVACLAVRALHVRYPNGAHAVRGVSFTVAAGEVLALVGESGCGKTTVLEAVLGVLPAGTGVSGAIVLSDPRTDPPIVTELHGLTRSELRSVRGRLVGYVAQNPYRSFDPLRTVGHHVASAWRVHGAKPPPGRVAALLEEHGITDAARRSDAHPHQWSGGMLQRASIAAARALAPPLVIADEPTSALDADVARATLALLRRGGTTVLLVTHDLLLAASVADRIAVLYGGVLVEEGAASSVLERARHPYTRALLDAVPRQRGVLPHPLPGAPPDPLDPPAGCPFAARCPRVEPRCAEALPTTVDGVACHLPLTP